MQFVPAAWRPTFRWGIPASVSVHAIVLALLIFGLPQFAHTPAEPEAIEVELTVPQTPQEPEQAEPSEPAPQAREEQAEAPEPVPDAVAPGEEQAEAPQAPAEPDAAAAADQAGQRPVAMLRPVFEFAEENAGPRQALDGDAVRSSSAATATPSEAELPDTPEQIAATPDTPGPDAVAVPAPAPDRPQADNRALDSRRDTGAAVATTAMEALPRGVRAGELCVTELREQLRRSLPPFWPDLLPAYRLDEGTVLQVRRGAFRAEAQWYELSFRCEIDEAATRVESFTFQVGAAVPRSQWQERGLPSQ